MVYLKSCLSFNMYVLYLHTILLSTRKEVDMNTRSVYVSLSDIVQKVQCHLEDNEVVYAQHTVFPNIFTVPAGRLEVRGVGVAPKYLLNSEEIAFAEICDAVSTV
jgi:hypothetical protein